MGHNDILDHPLGDGEDGLCVTSFYGENLISLRLGLSENMFSNITILCCVPLVSVNSLTFWGNGTVGVSCSTNHQTQHYLK